MNENTLRTYPNFKLHKVKTLKPLWQSAIIGFFVLISNGIVAQCAVNAGADITKCFGQIAALGSNVTASGGVSPYQYSWNGGTTWNNSPTNNVVANATNTYTVTIQDANGCQATDQILLTVLPLPVVNAGADVSICPGQSVQLCATATSVNGPIAAQLWLGGPAAACYNVSPTSTTIYTFSASDNQFCQATDMVTVTVFPNPGVNAGADQTLCLSAGTMQLTGSPAGGTWSGSGVSTSGLFTATTTGTFTLTYSRTTNQGCTFTDNMVMTVINPSPPNGGPDQTVCLNSNPIQLPNVGTWSGSALVTAGGLFTPSTAGSHTLTVSSSSGGCTTIDQVVINVLALPSVNAGADMSICAGATANLNGTASSSNGAITGIVWSGSGIGSTNTLATTATPGATNTYNLQVTDAAGCVQSDAVQVTVNALPVVDAGNNITVCSNASPTTLTGQSPAGGTWSGSGVNAAGVYTPGTAGSYTLTYTFTNALGCASSDTRTITVIDPTPVNAGADQSICLNASPIQLLNTGTWTGSTLVTPGGLFTPSAIGSYTLTYSAVVGQCTSTDQLIVVVKPLPTVNAGADQTICAGQSINLNGSANSANGAISTYSWTGSAISNSSNASTTATPAGSGNYTLSATDVANCTSSDVLSVTVNALPNVSAGANQTICTNGGAVTMSGFSPAGGTWSGSGITAGGVFTPTVAGTYTVTYTVTNAQSCTASSSKQITVVTPSSINAGPDVQVCQNSPAIQLMSGGTWSGSTFVTAGGLFTPSTIGSYTLTFTQTVGTCVSSDQIVVQVLTLPTANAGADQSICLGQTANLSGTGSSSNGSIVSYSWSGNALSSTNTANTSASPVANSNYTLTVTDAANCSATDAMTIVVNALPTVNPGADVSLCNQPIPYQLTGFAPAGGTWTGSNVTPAGVFTPNGTGSFQLTYCVTNGNGCQSCDHITVNVSNAIPANAGTDLEVCQNSGAITLTPVTPGGTWTATANLTSAGVFTPNTVGAFTCTYTLGSGTCQTTDTRVVTVYGLPSVNAGADASICAGSNHAINATVTGGTSPYDYSWTNASSLNASNIEDVTASPTANTTYTLTVTDDHNCVGTDAIAINVVALPVSSFTTASVGCINAAVAMNNTSTGATSYAWNFGNSTSSSATNPNATYTSEGNYTIQLTAYNSLNCPTTSTQNITIKAIPQAGFTLSAMSGCSPLNVGFTNTSTGSIDTYDWNLDGGFSNAITPSPVDYIANMDYADYGISLTVSNVCGSDVHAENVHVLPQPHADFSTDLSSQCSPVTTAFNNQSLGYPESFYWDLGNGEHSTDAVPSNEIYTTDDPSEDYTIKLKAFNSCGVDSVEHVLTILPNSVEMNITPSVAFGCSPMFVEFANNTTGATAFNYVFGDSGTSGLWSPNHLYNDAGVYDVYVYANDGCSFDTAHMVIEVLASPTIDITSSATEACPDETIDFSATTSGNITSINWDYGDGNSDTGTDVAHGFALDNFYGVSAYAQEANGCIATASIGLTVHPKPVMNMTVSPSIACSPAQVCSDNTSQGATSYDWNFGGVYSSTDANACYTFINTSGSIEDYTISLHAHNNFGCADSAFQVISVQPQPETSFTLSDDASCAPMETVNVNVNTSGSNAYAWFTDGTAYSEAMTPAFVFSSVGEHTIELISSNDFGCTDSYTSTYTIHPLPNIDIQTSNAEGCIPLEVAFINYTSDGATYNWSFSNGESSTDVSPSMVFVEEGNYDAQLLATSPFGCESMMYFTDAVVVHGSPVADFTFSPGGDIIYDLDIAFADSSDGAISYYWQFGDGYVSSEANPVHHYQTGGAFYPSLTVTNEYGCTDVKNALVNIDNTHYMYMPNSFTPNNDGVNDVFKPEMSSFEEIKVYEFLVMNRWGEVVFKTDDPRVGWTGSVNGGEFYTHNDCFTWTVKIEYNNKQVNRLHSGNVVVLR